MVSITLLKGDSKYIESALEYIGELMWWDSFNWSKQWTEFGDEFVNLFDVTFFAKQFDASQVSSDKLDVRLTVICNVSISKILLKLSNIHLINKVLKFSQNNKITKNYLFEGYQFFGGGGGWFPSWTSLWICEYVLGKMKLKFFLSKILRKRIYWKRKKFTSTLEKKYNNPLPYWRKKFTSQLLNHKGEKLPTRKHTHGKELCAYVFLNHVIISGTKYFLCPKKMQAFCVSGRANWLLGKTDHFEINLSRWSPARTEEV